MKIENQRQSDPLHTDERGSGQSSDSYQRACLRHREAKRLFRDMMQQAQIQFGFEADNIPLMIEQFP